jgi:chromosome segregation ATPase
VLTITDHEKAVLQSELRKFQGLVAARDSAIRESQEEILKVKDTLGNQVKTLKDREAQLSKQVKDMEVDLVDKQKDLMNFRSKSKTSEQVLTLFQHALQHKEHEVHKQQL